MALPPILSSLPIFKAFKADKTSESVKTGETSGSNQPQDVVQISEAALQKLEETQTQKISNPSEAKETAEIVRKELEDSSVSLGLDPQFES